MVLILKLKNIFRSFFKSNLKMEGKDNNSEVIVEENLNKETNPYAYLNRDEFSSERFKIEVKNLPKYYGVSELKKLVNDKLKLGSNKIKFPRPNSPYVFICFRSEEDRENGIKVINNFKWKGKELVAHNAKPAPDPLVKKRKDELNNENSKKKLKTDNETQENLLKSKVIPLWNIPYDVQLKDKQESMKKIFMELEKKLHKFNPNLRSWIETAKKLNDGLICKISEVRHPENIEGYRNKCEFTVGMDEETSLPTVGFRIGSYATGGVGVVPVENLIHVPEVMKKAAKVFQEFVRSSGLKTFDAELQTGYFRQLTVRCAPKQLMLIVGIHPQNLSEEDLNKLKMDLIEFFTHGPGKEVQCTSLYLKEIVKKKSFSDVSVPVHLYGETHIYQTIADLKFRISPEAFFQINTSGAKILYESVAEICNPQKDTTIVDVCCGTGTIGLFLAKSCSQVLGIEMEPQAIVDAKENAKINDIENCEFFEGKAEDILGSVLFRTKNDNIITVVDPPRAGLHQKVILQLRKTKKIKNIVYISCNPDSALKNFIDLARPASKTIQGDPFVPVKTILVDMFPYTKHCELIVYFERFSTQEESVNETEQSPVIKEENIKENPVKEETIQEKV